MFMLNNSQNRCADCMWITPAYKGFMYQSSHCKNCMLFVPRMRARSVSWICFFFVSFSVHWSILNFKRKQESIECKNGCLQFYILLWRFWKCLFQCPSCTLLFQSGDQKGSAVTFLVSYRHIEPESSSHPQLSWRMVSVLESICSFHFLHVKSKTKFSWRARLDWHFRVCFSV